MAYVGNQPIIGNWRKLDDISSSFNGSTTTFTTSVGGENVTVGSPYQLIVSVNDVILEPGTDFTVTTNSIIFTSAPAGGASFFAIYAGDSLNIGTISDGTVTTAKLADSSVTSTKLADSSVTSAKLGSSSVTTAKLADSSVTTGKIADGTIVNADVNTSAAIAFSKLATLTAGNILLGNGSNVATSTTVTGDVTINSSGVTAIGTGVIVNADINASAAIADTKLATISTAGKVSGTAITSGNISTSGSFATTSTMAVGQSSAAANTDFDLAGTYAQTVVAVGALNIDCSTGNYFTKTINGNSTFTVSSVPSSRAYSFTLELTHTSGTVTWFSGVEWPGGTAPTLTTGKTHLFMFVTDDGGTRWRASSLINYTN